MCYRRRAFRNMGAWRWGLMGSSWRLAITGGLSNNGVLSRNMEGNTLGSGISNNSHKVQKVREMTR
jgi:hypothetical protein